MPAFTFWGLLPWRTSPENHPQEFRHSKLRSNASIRLIRIDPELLRGDISCNLQQFDTDTQTCPDYTALSYVWGDSTPTATIYINGLAHRIHQSLWELLSHIQSTRETERIWYWTDRLCIDQARHSERNEQIARMGDIYAQAASVTSWLGNHDKTVDALKFFVDMYEGNDTASEPKYPWRSPKSERIHQACDQLAFQEPYWERVWVVQEVACARNCIVASGDVSLRFEDLLHRMEVAMARTVRFDNTPDRDRRMKRINAFASLRASIQGRRPVRLLELIQKTSFCQATRDHDKIYGLLGLASRLDSGFDPKALEITQHKTLVDVWWDIVFMILRKQSHISSVKDDMIIMGSLVDKLPPPRIPLAPEMGSSYRKALAERICLVSEAAYSYSTQHFLGLECDDIVDEQMDDDFMRMQLRSAWSDVTTHVLDRQLHGPCLQGSLGWVMYAGLRFTSWPDSDGRPATSTEYLPLGWFCPVHRPEAPSRITKKHRITSASLPTWGPRHVHPIYCSAAKEHKVRCNLSSAVLKIKPLGITCLVLRSKTEPEISFYCDCCEPSRAPVQQLAQVSTKDQDMPS